MVYISEKNPQSYAGIFILPFYFPCQIMEDYLHIKTLHAGLLMSPLSALAMWIGLVVKTIRST
jgi:hypothetical protein